MKTMRPSVRGLAALSLAAGTLLANASACAVPAHADPAPSGTTEHHESETNTAPPS